MNKHYEIDRVECKCGEIYANNVWLKNHILQTKNKALEEELTEANENFKILTEETTKVENELEAENEALKESRDGLLEAAKIVYKASDGGKYSVRDEIRVLEKPIQKAEELKPITTPNPLAWKSASKEKEKE